MLGRLDIFYRLQGLRMSIHSFVQVPYSDIVCKRVVLSCDAVQNELYMRFKIKLQEEYQKKKGQSVTA
ncbi:hypothetical protein DCAR_0832828 [Daucus carota subsp. sativus]|uniref:Uncharacterized protein n=1 Tax=Daucus carota subsp. sativus TaxID=79200 RepID=A0A175YQA0_DAUCS|nr:hypothetical protein DCAR_0832828 [Daucus carota subsp. sativus]